MLTRFFIIFNFIHLLSIHNNILIVSFFNQRLLIFQSSRRRIDNIIGELIITFLQFILILKDIRSVEVKHLNEI